MCNGIVTMMMIDYDNKQSSIWMSTTIKVDSFVTTFSLLSIKSWNTVTNTNAICRPQHFEHALPVRIIHCNFFSRHSCPFIFQFSHTFSLFPIEYGRFESRRNKMIFLERDNWLWYNSYVSQLYVKYIVHACVCMNIYMYIYIYIHIQ